MQKGDTYTTVEQRCNTTYETREDITGYNVVYRLEEKESSVKLAYDPGKKIPVENGQLVLAQKE